MFGVALLAFTNQIPTAAASENGGGSGGGFGTDNNTTLPPPYYLPASEFPVVANVTASGLVTGVAAVPLPGAVAGFAVAYGTTNASGSTLWFDEALYSSSDAYAIARNGSCGSNCGQVPISWNLPVNVSSFGSPIGALRIASAGPELVVVATSAGTTSLFGSGAPYANWTSLGPSVPGSLGGIAADPGDVAVATVVSDAVYATLVSAAGAEVGPTEIYPLGANATGVVAAGVALTPYGTTYLESVAFTVSGSNEIQSTSSTNGASFTTSAVIGAFSTATSSPALSPSGTTALSWAGGVPGQLALTSVDSDLFLLFTTNQSGQTVPATEVSGNNGTNWSGPYLTGPVNGSVANPSLAVGPTGLVYAAWSEPDFDSGATDEVTYSADGLSMAPPQTMVPSGQNGSAPVTPPAIAVDGFGRPLVLWGTNPVNGTTAAVAYTGGYLAPDDALNATQSVVTQTLAPPDLAGLGSSAAVSSLLSNVTALVAEAEQNLTAGNPCNAQNVTAKFLYQNLTHDALTATSGGGMCAPSFHPSSTASLLKATTGVEAPNTFYAVYLDWVLEAEGVTVGASPLTTVTDVYPYVSLALSATLPQPVSKSETENSETATATVTATPYSPSAFELAVASSIPATNRDVEGPECDPPRYLYRIWEYYYATVTTWTNVSINNGSIHAFTSTSGSYSSVWVYNLNAYQTYFWQGTYTARTLEVEEISDPCLTPAITYHNTTTWFPAMVLSGTFATTLSVGYGAGLVTAALNGNRTEARVSVLLNNTLPATIVSTLSNASGSQIFSSSSYSVPESYTFGTYSPVGQTYTVTESSTSRAGTSTAPGSPSFAYSSSGATPAENAGLWCQFTLSAAGPLVWTNNSTASTWPYSNINATTVDVSWYSNQDTTGFYSYHETGSSIVRTITGIVPVRMAPGNWSYSVEVYGLTPLASYGGAYGVSWTNGCLVEEDQLSGQVPHLPSDPGFATTDAFALSEEDQSFDSITGAGGGINLTWSTPKTLVGLAIGSGYLTIQNLSNPSWKLLLPVSASEIVPGTVGKKTVNVLSADPGLSAGTEYKATLTLNWTGQKPQSGSARFTYHLDSSGDGLTDLEKTAGWNVAYAPSGTVVVSKNRALHSNLLASNVIIDSAVTLTTNGYSIIAASEFINDGTIDTGTVAYPLNPSRWVNLTSSYGGSGGGAYGVVDSSGDYLCCGNGGSTHSRGGSESTSLGHNAGSGGTPGTPKLSNQLIGSWWNGSMSSYLSGAAGGLAVAGFDDLGGYGGWGLYIQANVLVAGRIISTGATGSVWGGICSEGQNPSGGGGGGGSVLLAYGDAPSGGYTPPPSGGFNASGGAAGACPGDASSGRGGSGQLLLYPFSTPPVPPPTSPTYAGSTMTVKPVHAAVSERVKVGKGWRTEPVFSTNGLDNDYLEKAYGLNPNTVDTAGSDMLDLWNLTFDLGSATATASSIPGIVVWSEVNSTTWDPWGPGASPDGMGGNISCTAASCPGNSSAVSSLLWNSANLGVFLNLSGVKYDLRQGNYLRGVVGDCPEAARSSCGTDRILTLWGKLSWGANPLAGSTPGDGIPDGARVNPVGGTDLQVNVTGWSATNTSSNFRTGDGVAAYIGASSSSTPDYGNFTSQTNVTRSGSSGSTSFDGSFVVTFPVDPTQQYAQLNLSLVQNTGVNGGSSYQTPLRTPVYPIDLESPGASSNVTLWSNSSQGSYMIQFHWRVLPVQAKDPTWIYIPDGNATLSALPQGLQRYTGEQNFVELVLNDTANASMSPVVPGLPYSSNTSYPSATYSFGLSPGLNNILVPRSVFLSTPLGRSVLNLSGSSTPDIAIPSANGDGFLQVQWQSEGSGALWFYRTTGANGYTKGSAGYIEVVASTSTVNSTNPTLTGGVPGNPSLESGHTSLAIQAIYAANESATTEVEGLLAGLLLNTSGNFTGWLLNATGELDTLGLLPSVMAGLANATYVNDGGYGPPSSSATAPTPPLPWWEAPFAWVWNSVSGVLTEAVSIVWNAIVAAATFMVDLARAADRFAFNVFSQVAPALEEVAKAILAALEIFLAILRALVIAIFAVIYNPIKSAVIGYGAGVDSFLNSSWAQENSSGTVSSVLLNDIWSALNGPVFQVCLALGIAVEVALILTSPLDLEGSFVVPLLAGTVMGGALASFLGLPFIDAFSSTALGTLRSFLVSLDPVPAIFLGLPLWQLLGVIAAAGSASAALISTLLYNAARTNVNPNLWELEFSGIMFAFSLVALALDLVGFLFDSPPLILLAFSLSALSAGVAIRFVQQTPGSGLSDYVWAIVMCGGLSAGANVVKLLSE